MFDSKIYRYEYKRFSRASQRPGRRRSVWRRVFALLLLAAGAYWVVMNCNVNPFRTVGEIVDSLDGVDVHYNGGINHTSGRSLGRNGYNIGLRYQCVEFVKRYYYERFDHEMPDAYGHARDFFDLGLPDGARNEQRALLQFINGEGGRPEAGDIVVFAPWLLNRFGHVAIVSHTNDDAIEVVQQNPGPFGKSRETFRLTDSDGKWRVKHRRVLGWLRREN